MTSLLGSLPDNILCLDGKQYRLMEIAGAGGSSVVYLARPVEDASKDYVIIKEFFPQGYGIERETAGPRAGELKIPAGYQEQIQSMRLRVMRESEIVQTLRDDRLDGTEDGRSNNGWFLSYSKPIEANHTLYTVITTESGKMLSQKIKNNEFSSFTDICDCILKILDALEPVHAKGFLHLDISPDNIHFSDSKIARLIDFNSAFQMGSDANDWIPSYKPGYSPRELTRVSPTKPPALSPATDLYAVVAIFFRMLVGRTPQEGDWISPKNWELSAGSGPLQGRSDLLVKQTNGVLRKGLSRRPESRFQSIAELRAAIEELQKMATELQLVHAPRHASRHFVGRKSEIAQIDQMLQQDNYVFLEGIGGSGKTELAKKYAEEYGDKYHTIQFVPYNKNLMATVAGSLEFYNFDAGYYDRTFGREKAEAYIFRDKMKSLQKCDSGVLLIVDNYNVTVDDHFGELVSGQYKVIFTTRAQHRENPLEVSRVMREEDLPALFCEYYKPERLSEEDEPAVREMIELVQGHVMTLMLIACAMREGEKTAGAMLARLKNSVDLHLPTSFAIEKEGLPVRESDQVMYRHILTLFDMAEIEQSENSNYAYIMANMAIVAYEGMAKKQFYQWALADRYPADPYGDEDYTDLNWLIKRGWVQFDADTRRISLHPVISDVAAHKLAPDSETCGPLLKGMLEATKDYGGGMLAEFDDYKCYAYRHMLELACKRIGDETETTANLLSRLADCCPRVVDLPKVMEYSEKAKAIREKVLGTEHPDTATSYNNIAMVYHYQGDYANALEWHWKALAVREKVLGTEDLDTAISYNNIAKVYHAQGDYANALKGYWKALTVFEKVFGPEHPATIANYNNNIAAVYYDQRDYANALKWYRKALIAFEKMFGPEHLTIAIICNNIAGTYYCLRKYANAMDWYRKGLTVIEKEFGSEWYSSTNYSRIADCYSAQGDYDTAREYSSKALTITINSMELFDSGELNIDPRGITLLSSYIRPMLWNGTGKH